MVCLNVKGTLALVLFLYVVEGKCNFDFKAESK